MPRQLLEAGKDEEQIVSWSFQKEPAPRSHLDFSPLRPFLGYLTPRTKRINFYQDTTFVGICYRSNGKLIQLVLNLPWGCRLSSTCFSSVAVLDLLQTSSHRRVGQG